MEKENGNRSKGFTIMIRTMISVTLIKAPIMRGLSLEAKIIHTQGDAEQDARTLKRVTKIPFDTASFH